MKTSPKALNYIRGLESLRLTAYLCPAGVPTIGYGHTRGVQLGQTIDRATAERYLAQDIASTEREVLRLTRGVTLTQGQFDALVSFVFNVGVGNFTSSTLRRYILSGRSNTEIAAQFGRWVYSGKKKLNGLVTRRAWEAARWQET